MTRAIMGSRKWVEIIATQTKIQNYYIQIIDYLYMNDVNCKVQCWIKMRCSNLFYVTVKDVSAIFVAAHGCAGGLKKKLNLWSGFPCDRLIIGFYCAHQSTGTGIPFFPRIRRNRYRTPLSGSWIQQMIELSLKKYVWNFWSCIPHFLGVEFPSPSQPSKSVLKSSFVISSQIGVMSDQLRVSLYMAMSQNVM